MAQTLRSEPRLDLAGLLDAANAWAQQGHEHLGFKLWSGPRPFGPNYVSRLLGEAWAEGLGSPQLHRQAQFIRENPKKTLTELEQEMGREARQRRDAQRRESAERRKRERAERDRREREQAERREKARRAEERRDAEAANRRLHNALKHVVAFLNGGGVDAAVRDNSVVLADGPVRPPNGVLLSRAKLDRWIDALVWERYRAVLRRSVSAHLAASDLGFATGSDGWIVSGEGAKVASVAATRAQARGGPTRRGNFLAPGEHWRLLADDLSAVAVPAPRQPKRRNVRLLSDLPDWLEPEVRDLAMDASRRLRTERNIALGHTVELQYDSGTIRFEPLRRGPEHIELPVAWSGWPEHATGELHVDGRRDPLPLRCSWEGGEQEVVPGWVWALAGFAELVCRPDLTDLSRSGAVTSSAGRLGASATSRPRERADRSAGTDRGRLRPIGQTVHWIASYVAGHRRLLRLGHHASDAARANAAKVGIVLRHGETWVSPHVRGVPPDAVLQFRWDAPHVLPRSA